jgi:hypothetical protein
LETPARTVHNVSIVAGRSGVIVTSDHNRLLNNAVTVVFGASFSVSGNQNLLTSNRGADGQLGFGIGGDQNLLFENSYTGLAFDGFAIGGNQNLLIRNNATETLESGFDIRGEGNRLVGNLALNSGFFGGSWSPGKRR